MKRLFAILMTLFVCATTTAQIENSIFIDPDSFRPAQDGLLSGLAIDPIRQDRSRRACVRQKIFFHRMTREEMAQLEPIFPSGTIDCIKCKVADYNSVLILEFTAKPNVRFYLKHPVYGTSNEVEFDYEGGREYLLEATLNQTYSIVVNSNVANADVYLDGVFMGKTNSYNSLTIKDVMIGGHRLKLTYGNVSAEQTIVVNDSSISFRLSVNTAANEPQFVVFTVEPQSAVVIIDNQHYTLTDGAMSIVLDGGSYSYTVTAAGYHPQSGTFTVAGSKVVKDICLKADAATVTLTAPDNAEIWVNGVMKGRSSWSGTLNSGTYIFEARKAGHKSATLSKHITSSEPVQSYTLPAPTPIFGWLVVLGTPINADVTLDGKAVGQLPLKLDNILVGEHTVVVSKTGYEPYTQSVTIAEGKTATINATLTNQLTSEQLRIKGDEYIEKKDFLLAIEYYLKAARQGDAKAQNIIGICYQSGLGVAQDNYEAVKWYRKAAEQGDAIAQNNLGLCYENGEGVTKSITEAVKWYKKAAEQGNANAQHNLGVCYENGRGVTKSITEAAKWYRKAAEQGNANAQCNLGVCYENGRGVTKSITEAAKWYRKAAEQGEANAQNNLGVCYEYGEGVTKSITEAVKWYKKAAEQGYARAKDALRRLGY